MSKTKSNKQALEALKSFEDNIDKYISAAPVLSYPIRTVLSNFFMVVDGLFNGHRFKRDQHPPDREKGSALVSRLSYILPMIIQKCPIEPIGINALDALSPFIEHPELFIDTDTFVQYGHFCEIMPEVRRGYYNVEGNEKDGFTLKHKTQSFSSYEEQDIALSELSIPFYLKPPEDDAPIYDGFAKNLKRFDYGNFVILIKKYFEHYASFAFELPILTEEGYVAGLGVTWNEFNLFRGGWAAVAEFCERMASAIARLINKTKQYENNELIGDLCEWTAVALKSTFLDGTLIGLTRLDPKKYDKISNIFSIDVTQRKAPHAGEGFFPPLIRVSTFILFNPDVVHLMMSSRNIPYAINRADSSLYSTLLSQHMEPALLSSVKEILKQIPGIEIELNQIWEEGEFDLVAFHSSSNSVLHIQAKAPIPPQGARMVQQIESRVLEGVEQLRSFGRQEQTKKDAVLSKIFHHQIVNPDIVNCIICRTSFGTEKIWSTLGDILAVNLHVLSSVVSNLLQHQQATFSFLYLANTARALIEQYVREVVNKWETGSIKLNGVKIDIPLLKLEHEKIEDYRLNWFPEGMTADRLRLAFSNKAIKQHQGAENSTAASLSRDTSKRSSDEKTRRKAKRKAAKVARKLNKQHRKRK